MLMNEGLRAGGCPELLNIESPNTLLKIHRAYIEAGADVITTNSFGGNGIKLSLYKAQNEVERLNRRAVEIAREAAERTKVYVAASVGPTGRFVEPAGDMPFTVAYDVFREQIEALAGGNPDFLLLETFGDLGEIRAALLAAKDVCAVPVICCLTYSGSHTLTGVSPAAAAVVLESTGAAALGANCSGGPEELYENVLEMQKHTGLPVIVQPNAGIPYIRGGNTIYPLGAEAFQRAMEPYLAAGINILGSCCGSTPEHTRLLKESTSRLTAPERKTPEPVSYLAGCDRVLKITPKTPPLIIGERINPTSRKDIIRGLKNKDYQIIRNEAEAQIQRGAHALDINIGTPGIDQRETMGRIINILQRSFKAPIVIDSTDPEVIEKGLRTFHGKAMVNSVNGEQKSLERILPLVKRYGAALIGLTLDETGIPDTAAERFNLAAKIVRECSRYGIPERDIYIDALSLTIGSDETAAIVTLETLRMIKENLKVNTILGISNISYGLPRRDLINAAFLAMAIANGLDAAIIDPLDTSIMQTWRGASLLAGRDKNAGHYLAWTKEKTLARTEEKIKIESAKGKSKGTANIETLKKTVVKGLQNIEIIIEKLLTEGLKPQEIIDRGLIPALDAVGHLYERGEYYLPQLMLSAETAQKAFGILERHFAAVGGEMPNKGTVVIGTVKGDIHDIGKNMVAAMLKNHGYKVIDLGKNVTPQKFVKAVIKENAAYAALSALMTTTMVEIPETIRALRRAAPDIKVIAGGAVITREFALGAGADGYGSDAVDAVNIIERLRRQ